MERRRNGEVGEPTFSNPLQEEVLGPIIDAYDDQVSKIEEDMPSPLNLLKRAERKDARENIEGLTAARQGVVDQYDESIEQRHQSSEYQRYSKMVDRVLRGEISDKSYKDLAESEAKSSDITRIEQVSQIAPRLERLLAQGADVSIAIINSAIPKAEALGIRDRERSEAIKMQDLYTLGILGAEESERDLYESQETVTSEDGTDVTTARVRSSVAENPYLRSLAERLKLRRLDTELIVVKAGEDILVTLDMMPE